MRRWIIDPSASPGWLGWEILSWVLVAGAVWLIGQTLWPLGWLALYVALGGW